jgi:hypothetical protein
LKAGAGGASVLGSFDILADASDIALKTSGLG